jgi:hypothetical protein
LRNSSEPSIPRAAVNDEREDVVDAADCLTAARGIEGSLEFLKAVIAIL